LLARRSARIEEGLFVVEGAVLISEALRGGWDVLAQYRTADASTVGGCEADDFVLGEGVLERVASTESPQPNMALVSRRTASLAKLEVPSIGVGSPWVLFLDAVSDPGNLGTILRSAEAFGASAVLLSTGSVDPTNPKVVRASAGAVFHVAVVEDASLVDVREAGYSVVGTSSHEDGRTVALDDADLSGKVCLAMGNEARGLEESFGADTWVTIPHRGRSESLNVAMAATIMCFATANQHSRTTHNE